MKVPEQFLRDRKKALSSLDKFKILSYMLKYEIPIPGFDEGVFWIGVHKARTADKTLSSKERSISRQWLIEQGYEPL